MTPHELTNQQFANFPGLSHSQGHEIDAVAFSGPMNGSKNIKSGP